MALTTLEERIMRAIGRNRVSISEIESAFFGMDRPIRRTVQRALIEMARKNLIRRFGTGRGTKYEKA